MDENAFAHGCNLNIGDRLVVENSFCTVRYVGETLDQDQRRSEGAELAQGEQKSFNIIGIEWDNGHNGKTKNGFLKGTKYFEPQRKDCFNCSFYKLNGSFCSKYITNVRKSFSRYIKDLFENKNYDQVQHISGLNQLSLNHQKNVQLLGFDEEQRRKMLLNSESLDLSYCNIWTYQDEEEEDLVLEHYQNYFDGVFVLNISYNLISKVETVQKIIKRFSNLQTLIMNGLRFSNYVLTCSLFPRALKRLSLSNHQTCDVLHLLPENHMFEILDLSNNNLGELQQSGILEEYLNLSTFHSVELNLSFNDLHFVPHISNTVKHLNISNNQITQRMNAKAQKRAYRNVLSLNIESNKVSHWDDLFELVMVIFPQLNSLNLNNNFIQASVCPESSDDLYEDILARLPYNITRLDYNQIDLEAQKDCQRFLINKWKQGKISYPDLFLVQLLKKNNILETVSSQQCDVQNSSHFLSLVIMPYNVRIKTLKTCTVRYLKFQIFERLGKPATYCDYYKKMTIKYKIVNEVYETFKYDFTPLSDYNIQTNDNIFVSFA